MLLPSGANQLPPKSPQGGRKAISFSCWCSPELVFCGTLPLHTTLIAILTKRPLLFLFIKIICIPPLSDIRLPLAGHVFQSHKMLCGSTSCQHPSEAFLHTPSDVRRPAHAKPSAGGRTEWRRAIRGWNRVGGGQHGEMGRRFGGSGPWGS